MIDRPEIRYFDRLSVASSESALGRCHALGTFFCRGEHVH